MMVCGRRGEFQNSDGRGC